MVSSTERKIVEKRTAEQRAAGVVVDYNVGGLAVIRLVNPNAQVLEAMVCQLGRPYDAATPGAEPDICVNFVDSRAEEELRVLELNGKPFGYSREHFYLLDGQGYRTRIDFRELGGRINLECERGVSEIPLLTSLLAVSLLRKGHLMLHAAAFNLDGRGIVAAGWQTGGKSELLLAHMQAGAHYIADEWTIIRSGDRKLCGLHSDVNTWDWQLKQLPLYRARIADSARRRLALLDAYRRLFRLVAGASGLSKHGKQGQAGRPAEGWLALPAKIDHEAAIRARVSTSPSKLFVGRVNYSPVTAGTLFLASVREGPKRTTEVMPMDAQEIAERMLASQTYERRDLQDARLKYRFAFPQRESATLPELASEELAVLSRALNGLKAYEVVHPYPPSLRSLYRATEPFCR